MAELDPAALHRATKLLPPQVGADPDYRRVIAEGVITSYLAALPEPPLDEWLKDAEQLIRDFSEHEDRPCSFDHHGYCQEHGWFSSLTEEDGSECPIPRARRWLKALAEHRKEGQHG